MSPLERAKEWNAERRKKISERLFGSFPEGVPRSEIYKRDAENINGKVPEIKSKEQAAIDDKLLSAFASKGFRGNDAEVVKYLIENHRNLVLDNLNFIRKFNSAKVAVETHVNEGDVIMDLIDKGRALMAKDGKKGSR